MEHSRRFLCRSAPMWLNGTATSYVTPLEAGGRVVSNAQCKNDQLFHYPKHCVVKYLYTDKRHTAILYQKPV